MAEGRLLACPVRDRDPVRDRVPVRDRGHPRRVLSPRGRPDLAFSRLWPRFSGADPAGMPQQISPMFHQLYYHVVWTTRDRRPTITRDVAVFLDRVLRSIANQERALILELGMVTTHVHLLIRAHPMTAISRLLQRLKGASSALAARELGLPREHQLRWAQGYTIQTVSRSMVGVVSEYVRHQPERHPHEIIAGWMPTATLGAPAGEPVVDDVGCIERHDPRTADSVPPPCSFPGDKHYDILNCSSRRDRMAEGLKDFLRSQALTCPVRDRGHAEACPRPFYP